MLLVFHYSGNSDACVPEHVIFLLKKKKKLYKLCKQINTICIIWIWMKFKVTTITIKFWVKKNPICDLNNVSEWTSCLSTEMFTVFKMIIHWSNVQSIRLWSVGVPLKSYCVRSYILGGIVKQNSCKLHQCKQLYPCWWNEFEHFF